MDCLTVFSYFSYFKKIEVGFCDLHSVCVFLYLCVCVSLTPTSNFRMPEPVVMKLGVYIIASEPISTAYFINPSHQSVCLYVYSPLSLLGNGSVNTFPLYSIRVYATIE
jgi:hypothetical protein